MISLRETSTWERVLGSDGGRIHKQVEAGTSEECLVKQKYTLKAGVRACSRDEQPGGVPMGWSSAAS